MKHLGIFLLSCVLLGCGQAPPPEPEPEPAAAAPERPAPRDESRRFPEDGLVEASIAMEHVLDKDYLPAGNVAVYERDDEKFSLFLISTDTAEQATMLSFDVKGRFDDAKFVPSYGGYFGTNEGQPWLIFPRNRAFAGVVGLTFDEADRIARAFAARMD